MSKNIISDDRNAPKVANPEGTVLPLEWQKFSKYANFKPWGSAIRYDWKSGGKAEFANDSTENFWEQTLRDVGRWNSQRFVGHEVEASEGEW